MNPLQEPYSLRIEHPDATYIWQPRKKWYHTQAAQFLFGLAFVAMFVALGLAYMAAFPDAPTGTADNAPAAHQIRITR